MAAPRPIPDYWVHDGWIAILILAISRRAPIAEPLIQCRQLASQQISEKRRGLVEQYGIAQRQGVSTSNGSTTRPERCSTDLESQTDFEPHPFVLPLRRETVALCEERLAVHAGRRQRLPSVVTGLSRGRYSRLDRSWKAAAQDVLL